jgi:hypothetical protein
VPDQVIGEAAVDRRRFIEAASALSVAALAQWRRAAAAPRSFDPSPADGWRVFEITTRVEPRTAGSATRVWVLLPSVSVEEAAWLKPMGNLWQGNAANVAVQRESTYGALMLGASWEVGEAAPLLEVTSRFATRDRAVDLAHPGKPPALDTPTARLYTRATELLPTGASCERRPSR